MCDGVAIRSWLAELNFILAAHQVESLVCKIMSA